MGGPLAEPVQVERFVVALHRRFGMSEAMLPQQRARIDGEFVEPQLASGGKAGLVSWSALRERARLLVCGPPGSGKTTLLRHWLLWHADRARRGVAVLLPLCVPLRHFRPGDTVEGVLRREALDGGAPWLGRDLEAFAREGRLAIAFDGLDEVAPAGRAAVAGRLRDFTGAFPDCHYLVVARPEAAAAGVGLGLARADLLPFDRARARQLAYHRLFETGSWKSFAARLEAEPALAWIAANPLALSLVVARFLRGELSPSDYAEHVGGVVDMLVDGWDSSRGIVRAEGPALSPAAKRRLLAELAAGGADDGSEPALAAIAAQTGLLARGSGGRWAFADDSFCGYFEAVAHVSALGPAAATPEESAGPRAGFSGFLDGGPIRVGRLLARTGPDALAAAVTLTEMLGQSLFAPPPALLGYARLVAALLDRPMRGAAVDGPGGEGKPPLSFTVRRDGVADEDAFPALIAALHRSRGGAAAKALGDLIESGGHPHLAPIGALLGSEGELREIRTAATIGWSVAEILPAVPAGPGGGP
jgi:energy-coupling factor transporter ATP-binding protein EcfA2